MSFRRYWPPLNTTLRMAGLLLSLSLVSCASDRPSENDLAAATARRARVEQGLLLPVHVRGETLVSMSLPDRMRHFHVPGVSIAVVKDGRLDWTQGYGVGTAGGADSITTLTLFQAGSISKPIAALGALHGVDAGTLALDDDVNARLVSWKIPENEWTRVEKVTLRRILTHTAGTTVHGFPGYAVGTPVPTLAQILDGTAPANTDSIRVDTTPGTLWRYSGGGFTVMQQLLIDVSGMPFHRALATSVLEPLGMTNSTYEQPLPTALVSRAASGHDGEGRMIEGKWHVYPEEAAAGLWSTPSDLVQVILEIHRAQAGESAKVLSRETTEAMLRPHDPGGWGLGWGLAGTGPAHRFHHGGDTVGYKALLVGFPERGDGAVIMTNGDGGAALCAEILRGIAVIYDWPEGGPKEKVAVTPAPAVLAAYAGDYTLDIAPGLLLRIYTEADSLRLDVVRPGGSTDKDVMVAESDTTFFNRESDFGLTFRRGSSGRVEEMVIHQGDEEYVAKRMEK